MFISVKDHPEQLQPPALTIRNGCGWVKPIFFVSLTPYERSLVNICCARSRHDSPTISWSEITKALAFAG